MNVLLQTLKWLVTSALFLLLFAFSLNNQTPVQLHFIFGLSSKIPLIMVILVAVGCGVFLGVLGMLPHWLRLRHNSRKYPTSTAASHTSPPDLVSPNTYRHSTHITDYGV